MATAIKSSDIEHIAELARLKLNGDELDALTHDLGEILNYVGQLAQVDVEQVDRYASEPVSLGELRPDEARNFAERDLLLSGERFRNGLLVTKAIMQNNDDQAA